MRRVNLLEIRLPEGVTFSYQLASPFLRMIAVFLDTLCIMGALGVLGTVVGFLGLVSPDFAQAVYLLLTFAVFIGYHLVCEWMWRGQSIGKRAVKIRVVDAGGLRLHFNQIVIRNLLRFVDGFPIFYLIGGTASFLHPRYQRLGDIAANTVVVRVAKMYEPDLSQITAGKFNSLAALPHLAARLRQLVEPRDAAVLLQAVMRREEFEPEARVELFREAADYLKTLVRYPDEICEMVNDEQYVRNVVDILYSPRGKAQAESKSRESRE